MDLEYCPLSISRIAVRLQKHDEKRDDPPTQQDARIEATWACSMLAGSNAMPVCFYAPASCFPREAVSFKFAKWAGPAKEEAPSEVRVFAIAVWPGQHSSGICSVAHTLLHTFRNTPYQTTLCGGRYRGYWGTAPSFAEDHGVHTPWTMFRTLRPRNNPYCSSSVESIVEDAPFPGVPLRNVTGGVLARYRLLWPIPDDLSGAIGAFRTAANEN